MLKEIQTIYDITSKFQNFHKNSLPLCAAENVISDFVKEPLKADFQERYIMGSAYNYSIDDNFIGSEYILPYYKMIDDLGKELFHAKFTDARTLTGMNAANLLISALCQKGDNIMILGKSWGGHASMRPTFERLGANVFEAPYNLDEYDFDYGRLNQMLKEQNIKFLNIAPSDILFEHHFEKIDTSNTVVLFDYSQTLGLIAAGLLQNPLDYVKNSILFGGTHKTMPGPAHGLIMTNSDDLYDKIDKEINPKYLRNIQTHQVVSLLFTMIEMKYFGVEYQKNTVRIANCLGEMLTQKGFTVAQKNGIYTQTHQLFLEMPKENMEIMFQNAQSQGITLNTKKKALFHGGYGIRLGLQEISRYNWDNDALQKIADILYQVSFPNYDKHQVEVLMKSLPDKKINFTFNKDEYNFILNK